jgi:3-methyladenine DNA glycosylase/8-oxoguanine DNA glycosylase
LIELQAIPGIGAWTAQYVAMRALNEPDAFLTGDLVLRRMTGDRSARELDRMAEAWRPWRGYAVMLLWQAARDLDQQQQRAPHGKMDPDLRAVGRRRSSGLVAAGAS